MLLDLNQSTVSRLGLEPIKDGKGGYLFNGITPATVTGIEVDFQDHEKGDFSGKKVPVLKVEFANYKLNPEEVDRFLTHSFKPIGTKELVENSTDTYKDRAEVEVIKNIQEQWGMIKHFLENLSGGPNYKDVTKISKDDFTKYFNLPSTGSADDRLAAWEAFYSYIASFVNGDGNESKSQIMGADGKALPIWIKITPNFSKDPKRNKKYYEVGRFIGQGIFEPLKLVNNIVATPKVLRIKPSESLDLLATSSPANAAGKVNMGGATETQQFDPAVMALLQAAK